MLWRYLLRLLLLTLLLRRVVVSLALALRLDLGLLLNCLLTSLLILDSSGLHHQIYVWHLHPLPSLQNSQLLGLGHAVDVNGQLGDEPSSSHLRSERRLLLLHRNSSTPLTWHLHLPSG